MLQAHSSAPAGKISKWSSDEEVEDGQIPRSSAHSSNKSSSNQGSGEAKSPKKNKKSSGKSATAKAEVATVADKAKIINLNVTDAKSSSDSAIKEIGNKDSGSTSVR